MGILLNAIVEIFVPAHDGRPDHREDVAEVQLNKHGATHDATYRLTQLWPKDASIGPAERAERLIETGMYHGTADEFEAAIAATERANAEDAPSPTAIALVNFARVLEHYGDGERVRILFYTS